MTEAIIFDWGGVLIEDPAPGMLHHICSTLGVTREAFARSYRKILSAFQKGTMSEDDMWERVCGALGVKKPSGPSLWREAFRSAYLVREEVFALVHTLRANGYKVGLLSNTEVPAMHYFYENHANVFHTLVFSCAEGTVKPERKIYEIALERLQAEPAQTVFIDDRKDFIAGAQELNINTILFTSLGQVKGDLGKFVALAL